MSDNKTKREDKELTVDNKVIGTVSRNFAQIYNFEQLKDVLMQNVGRKATKTYTQFTKERLTSFLTNPYNSVADLRQVSQFLYTISSQYRTLINYLSNMLVGAYNVVYVTPTWGKALKGNKFIKEYQRVCLRLQNMNIAPLTHSAVATCLRDGIYIGFTYDDEKSFYVNALDPAYCKISGLTDKNTYKVKFDASFFDSGNNKEFLYGINNDGVGVWDKVFIDGYETYKSEGRDFQWFELPVEKTICIICGDDPLYPLPYFSSVFQDLIDILDYRDLIRSKTELENYVLLISKIPLLNNSNEVNDFAVDLGLVQATQEIIDEALPSLAASAYSPCSIEKIEFGNKNQTYDNDVYSNSIKNLFNTIGISQMLFNSDKSGSVGLRHSIRVDEAVMFDFLLKVEANIKRYLKLNISEDFDFYFHKISWFNKDDYGDTLKDKATLGIPCKLDLATIDKTPYEMMNSTYMENALGLTDGENPLWKPLSSSYTQSSSVGAPQKAEGDLTDEGQATKDGNKNDTTKAGE